jgi:hypothetical protein
MMLRRCAAAEERVRAGPMIPRRCAFAEEFVRAGALVSRESAGFAWVHIFKNLSPLSIQRLGKGKLILCYGWPAVASGQGDMVVKAEMER